MKSRWAYSRQSLISGEVLAVYGGSYGPDRCEVEKQAVRVIIVSGRNAFAKLF